MDSSFHELEAKVGQGLQALLELEEIVQVEGDATWCLQPTPEAVRAFHLALIVEVTELVQEFNWKPWKKEQPVDNERLVQEYADILAFVALIGNQILNQTGVSAVDLAHAFVEKSLINIERLRGRVEGYGADKTLSGASVINFRASRIIEGDVLQVDLANGDKKLVKVKSVKQGRESTTIDGEVIVDGMID